MRGTRVKFLQLQGRRFGRLIAIKKVRRPKSAKSGTFWLLACRCGRMTKVNVGNLRAKSVQSCGCLRRHRASHLHRMQPHFVHGEARVGKKTPEYQAYIAARSRTENPNNKSWKYYGGRGVTFRFLTFEGFLNALKTRTNPSGRRPTPQHSIDRINPNKSYQRGNIRWADKQTQVLNRRQKAA